MNSIARLSTTDVLVDWGRCFAVIYSGMNRERGQSMRHPQGFGCCGSCCCSRS